MLLVALGGIITSQAPLRAVAVCATKSAFTHSYRVADVGRDLRRREGQFFDLDLNDVGASRSRHEDEEERAEHSDWPFHDASRGLI